LLYWVTKSLYMTLKHSNRYNFQCEVAEMISRNGRRIIRVLCNPGTIIIEVPDDGKMQLGDKVQVSGRIEIESMEAWKNNV
jgi:hypothetical protein